VLRDGGAVSGTQPAPLTGADSANLREAGDCAAVSRWIKGDV
jgi:hypothetical protein